MRISLPALPLWLALAGPACAASFTAEEAVEHALRHNPDLVAARLVIHEARGRALAAGRLADPEAEVLYLPGTGGNEYVLGFGFTQQFPLTARLRHERALSSARLEAATAEVRNAEWALAREVRLRVVKWQALDAHLHLGGQQAANGRALAAAVRAAARAGESAGLEAAQLELEAEALASPQLHHELARATLAGEFRALLGLAPDAPFTIAGTLPPPVLPPAGHGATGSSPRLAAAQARAAAAGHAVALAHAGRWQDVGVGLWTEQERLLDQPAGLRDEQRVGVRLAVPLPLWRRQEGPRLEALSAAERARLEAAAETARLAHEHATAHGEMAAALRLHENLSTVLVPRAVQLEEELGRAHAAGQVPLADVFRARDQRLRFESEQIAALEAFHLARVRLAAAAGLDLSETPP